jgi:hypothetical protein
MVAYRTMKARKSKQYLVRVIVHTLFWKMMERIFILSEIDSASGLPSRYSSSHEHLLGRYWRPWSMGRMRRMRGGEARGFALGNYRVLSGLILLTLINLYYVFR